MNRKYFIIVMLSCLFLQSLDAAEREIAITIDDLPFVGSCNSDPKKLNREKERFEKILTVLKEENIPATGFVVAGSIEKGQFKLLEEFKDAGLILGNHTYSHRSLNNMSADQYIADIDRADKTLTPLFGSEKYFRYPYLAESSGVRRQQVHKYLATHQYQIAPVSIDSKDYRFNQQLYAIPWRLRAQNLARIKQRYLAYIWRQTLYAENEAKKNPNFPAKHILLIHANLINSHFLGDIITLYRQRGFHFISLKEALTKAAQITTSKLAKPQITRSSVGFWRRDH